MPTSNGSRAHDIRAVVFDWRGTLVSELTPVGWVREALRRVGRDYDDHAVTTVLRAIQTPESLRRMRSPQGNTSAERHRDTYYGVFTAAGLDSELADELWAVESDPAYNRFAVDAAETFASLAKRGCKIGVLSNIHFDIRPVFERARLLDSVDAFVLSCEHGIQKPDPAIFHLALEELGTGPECTLMVGDRPSRDGVAVDIGMSTLLVPTLLDHERRRLHLVTSTVGAHREHRGARRARRRHRATAAVAPNTVEFTACGSRRRSSPEWP
ncbi:HAD family hydrolase [Nocardia sp. NPDC005366]|uniref:HAD family hydrolase n=1 Tax=Nocardia sp. NPDC005366 TaxID=3156878 RepID=UPI0033B46C1C